MEKDISSARGLPGLGWEKEKYPKNQAAKRSRRKKPKNEPGRRLGSEKAISSARGSPGLGWEKENWQNARAARILVRKKVGRD